MTLLLEHGVHVNQAFVDDESRLELTPSIAAVVMNCPDIVDALLAHGAKDCDANKLYVAVLQLVAMKYLNMGWTNKINYDQTAV